MFKAGQQVYATIIEKYKSRAFVQVKKVYITDILRRVEDGELKIKYMVSLIDDTLTLVTEDCIFMDYAQALEASKKLQKIIDSNESAQISSQVDSLLKNKELNNKSLKEGLRWLIANGFIEVIIR